MIWHLDIRNGIGIATARGTALAWAPAGGRRVSDHLLRLVQLGPPPPRREGPRIVASRGRGADGTVASSGRDSDLEAFSRNPSDGSLAPLAYQPST